MKQSFENGGYYKFDFNDELISVIAINTIYNYVDLKCPTPDCKTDKT